tara:strand:+ start:4270 stop:4665 length:396 start_codon:yes stop_codon:yes gene_type:complete
MTTQKTTQKPSKILTCSACGLTDSWTLIKSTFGVNCGHTLRLCSCGATEGAWEEWTRIQGVQGTAQRLESALEEVARLTKMLKRHEAAEDARAAAMAASLPEVVEQAQHAENTAAAADIYGSFGRDEWPTR